MEFLKIQEVRWTPSWKIKNRHIWAIVWPIGMKFGKAMYTEWPSRPCEPLNIIHFLREKSATAMQPLVKILWPHVYYYYYPHVPTGKVWIYRLLFVCLFVCVFVQLRISPPKNKASGVKFYTAVHRSPGQGISYFCELCSSRSPKSDESASAPPLPRCLQRLSFGFRTHDRAECGREIGMCGYMSVPTDVLVVVVVVAVIIVIIIIIIIIH